MMARLVLADAFRLGVFVVFATACSEPDPGNPPAASAPVSRAPAAPAPRAPPLPHEEVEAACAQGHQAACSHLGVLLLGDAPTAPDAAAVIPLFQRACDANDAEGCFQLGTLYAAGLGIAAKADVAAALFDRACDGGEPRACESLSRVLAEGRPGVPRDPARARSYRERACRSGHAPSCEAPDPPAR